VVIERSVKPIERSIELIERSAGLIERSIELIERSTESVERSARFDWRTHFALAALIMKIRVRLSLFCFFSDNFLAKPCRSKLFLILIKTCGGRPMTWPTL